MTNDTDSSLCDIEALLSLSPKEAFARIFQRAKQLVCSDIFLLTEESSVRVAVRRMGRVEDLVHFPSEQGRRLIRYVKAEAGLDITETRRPLDGRWIYEDAEDRSIDLRINSMPTLFGIDLSMRVLDREMNLIDVENLGMLRAQYNNLQAMLNSPSGLVLVTGPTGAGKTTTIYALLQHLNDGTRKINTIEDPIEYVIQGLRQSQVNTRFSVGFAELLQSILRQAPDVIMIGEVRDPLTAQTAVRAANSGHLVFATLHAPIAAAAIHSMLNLDVRPHFLASSLLGVISQRLVRCLCQQCRVAVDVSEAPHMFDGVKQWMQPEEGDTIYAARGCEACNHDGYDRRTGVFEVLRVSPEIRQLVATSAPLAKIGQASRTNGMIEFRHSALLKVAQGETTIEEVFRTVPTEYLGT